MLQHIFRDVCSIYEVERFHGSSSGWISRVYDGSGEAGNPDFWIGLYFHSDGWDSWSDGVYVDDLMVVRYW